jgi:hypothetical protein
MIAAAALSLLLRRQAGLMIDPVKLATGAH